MSLPLVTVIITTYNRKKYLEKAIQSVVNQSYSNIEMLVVDDGSKVNYAASICANFLNCTYINKENGGLSSARNYGINLAKGEFIAFLDDDDFWASSKIEKQVKILLENSSVDCVHSAAAVVNEKGELTGELIGASQNKIHKRSGYVFWNALGSWVIKSPTPLIRKKVFQSDLMFDETIKVGEDVDFYQRMFYRHKVFYINEPLAFYRQYEDENRLSVQLEKYIGIEKKMYHNFKRMKIRNHFVFYLIKIKLIKSYIKRWNAIFKNDPIKSNEFEIWIKANYLRDKYFEDL